jgi:hypothetical protein
MSCGGPTLTNTLDQALCCFGLEDRAVEQPGPVVERMDGIDVTSFGGDAQLLGGYAQPSGGLGQVHPAFGPSDGREFDGGCGAMSPVRG